MDLALALVEEDLGRDLALQVSRWLVMFVQRPGGQSQFSSQLSAELVERRPLRDLQTFIAEHPEADLSVDALAARLAISPRHFARAVRQRDRHDPRSTSRSRASRSPAACSRPPTWPSSASPLSAGFGTVETLQRAFRRRVHVTPHRHPAATSCASIPRLEERLMTQPDHPDPANRRAAALSACCSSTGSSRSTPSAPPRCSGPSCPPGAGCRPAPLEVHLVAEQAGSVTAGYGFVLGADRGYDDCPPLDVLVVPGGTGGETDDATARIGRRFQTHHEPTLAFVRGTAERGGVVASVCTGAFVRRAPACWPVAAATPTGAPANELLALMAALWGGVRAVAERGGRRRRHRDRRGVSSGIDVALTLVRRFLGDACADLTATVIERETPAAGFGVLDGARRAPDQRRMSDRRTPVRSDPRPATTAGGDRRSEVVGQPAGVRRHEARGGDAQRGAGAQAEALAAR